MTWHPRGACHDEDCPACLTRAELTAADYEADPLGWMADREAERYEREVLGL